MNHEYSSDGGFEVIGFGFGSVEATNLRIFRESRIRSQKRTVYSHFDGECSTGNLEKRSTEEVVLEFGCIESGRHDYDFEIGTTFRDILQETHQDIGSEGTFVRFVENDSRVSGEHVIVHSFS